MSDDGITNIEITFPVPVQLPEDWERRLGDLVSEICTAYEKEHSDQRMWTSSFGSKILWREPEEPDFDNSFYCIGVSVQERP